MKHFMDISRIKENESSELRISNIGAFQPGDIIQISEKIDGANASIALGDNGNLVAFSRKNELNYQNNLRGFWNYVQTLDKEKFQDLGSRVCFGEWLVSHTVKYNADAYNKWYVYDMYDTETEEWLPQSVVKEFAEVHGLEYIHVLYEGEFISWDHCRTFLNSPAYGDKQEGIVVKNQSKLNYPDVRRPFYLKIVNDSFSETKTHNYVKKVLDPQHQEEKNQAEEIANEVVTKARVQKEIHKMIDEGILPEKLQPKDMSMVARNLPKRIYDDIVKEELERISDTIGNQYFGKAVNAVTMNYAKDIILG
jgi:hypothetical protein